MPIAMVSEDVCLMSPVHPLFCKLQPIFYIIHNVLFFVYGLGSKKPLFKKQPRIKYEKSSGSGVVHKKY